MKSAVRGRALRVTATVDQHPALSEQQGPRQPFLCLEVVEFILHDLDQPCRALLLVVLCSVGKHSSMNLQGTGYLPLIAATKKTSP